MASMAANTSSGARCSDLGAAVGARSMKAKRRVMKRAVRRVSRRYGVTLLRNCVFCGAVSNVISSRRSEVGLMINSKASDERIESTAVPAVGPTRRTR